MPLNIKIYNKKTIKKKLYSGLINVSDVKSIIFHMYIL